MTSSAGPGRRAVQCSAWRRALSTSRPSRSGPAPKPGPGVIYVGPSSARGGAVSAIVGRCRNLALMSTSSRPRPISSPTCRGRFPDIAPSPDTVDVDQAAGVDGVQSLRAEAPVARRSPMSSRSTPGCGVLHAGRRIVSGDRRPRAIGADSGLVATSSPSVLPPDYDVDHALTDVGQ